MEINIVPKFLDEALTPIGKEVGQRLSDIVSLLFTPVIKAKAVRDKNIELFLNDLDNQIKKIPEENLKEPSLNMVGPALEDFIKFYHDEEFLRKLLAKLISSSMDKNSSVHPSYIKIIEQLSASDAKILRKALSPMVAYRGTYKKFFYSHGEFILYFCGNTDNWEKADLFYLDVKEFKDKPLPAHDFRLYNLRDSLLNLKRLGLIEFGEPQKFADESPPLATDFCPRGLYKILISISKYGLSFAKACYPGSDNEEEFLK